MNTTWVAVWMLHELTVCLGSSYWLNISFCWDKPEWQRQEETPPLIIPLSLPLFILLSFPLFIQLFLSVHPPILMSAHPSIIHLSLSTPHSLFFVPFPSFLLFVLSVFTVAYSIPTSSLLFIPPTLILPSSSLFCPSCAPPSFTSCLLSSLNEPHYSSICHCVLLYLSRHFSSFFHLIFMTEEQSDHHPHGPSCSLWSCLPVKLRPRQQTFAKADACVMTWK